jgi:hypothetical protein
VNAGIDRKTGTKTARVLPRIGAILALITVCGLAPVSGTAHSGSPIVVRDLKGASVAPLARAGQKGAVLVFITHDCPIANGYAPEIERIYRAYVAKRVPLYLVYVDASLTPAEARAHRAAYRYTCPAVLDPNHRLVKAARARVTPEAALFAPDGKLIYHGRIDDRAAAFGQVRTKPTRHDLRDALDAFLSGAHAAQPSAPAIGCTIADLGHP